MTQPFTIYLMQLAHTDIGYTHPQETIGRMYLEFYDRVLDLCQQTACEPLEKRFKWTCETFWQVHHYLQHRPEREEEFLRFVRAGQIEITATYLHSTDMIDADAYRRSVKLAVEYCRQHNLPLKSAIHSDINGWPWSTADILAEYNIPYFCSHVHLDSATDPLGKRGSIHYMWHQQYPEGHIAPDAPIRVPRMFSWQGPANGRVLHWFGEHYHLGNVLGLSGTQEFPVDKGLFFTESDRMSAGELYATAQRELPRYLAQLRAAGYPYEMLLLTTSGFLVDNSPPDDRWCEIISRWNAENDRIQLRTATVSEWFEDFQARYPETEQQRYPSYHLAWPDYWAHGLGSATNAVALARSTQRRRLDVVSLVEQSRSSDAQELLDLALEQERLSLEHTFGAWSTTAYPASQFNAFQQAAKELTFYRAANALSESASRALRALVPKDELEPSLYVGSRNSGSGLRTIHFTAEDFRLDPQRQMLRDAQGRDHPFQEENTALRRYVAVLPCAHAAELHAFRLVSAPAREQPVATPRPGDALSLETEAWRLRISPDSGQLLSMYESASDREWVDRGHRYGFGQFVRERIVHPWGRNAASNQARLLALDVAGDKLKQEMPRAPVFERELFSAFTTRERKTGAVFDEVKLTGEDARSGQVEVSWRLYHALPLVELAFSWNKPWSDLPEAAYIAFPFALTAGTVQFESGDAFFSPGSHEAGGQLPGTCAAYYTVQRAVEIKDANKAELLWLPLDAPLVMPNDIDFNHWETEPWQWNGFLASMPVNHYWHTNFANSQRGLVQLRYRFVNPQRYATREQAIQTATQVEALGWR